MMKKKFGGEARGAVGSRKYEGKRIKKIEIKLGRKNSAYRIWTIWIAIIVLDAAIGMVSIVYGAVVLDAEWICKGIRSLSTALVSLLIMIILKM